MFLQPLRSCANVLTVFAFFVKHHRHLFYLLIDCMLHRHRYSLRLRRCRTCLCRDYDELTIMWNGYCIEFLPSVHSHQWNIVPTSFTSYFCVVDRLNATEYAFTIRHIFDHHTNFDRTNVIPQSHYSACVHRIARIFSQVSLPIPLWSQGWVETKGGCEAARWCPKAD